MKVASMVCDNSCNEVDCLTLSYSSVHNQVALSLQVDSSDDEGEDDNHNDLQENLYVCQAIEHNDINPKHHHMVDAKYIAAMIQAMISVKKIMDVNMHCLGQNTNDPWLYVNAVLRKAGEMKRLSQIAVYYFYMQCREHTDLNSSLTCLHDCSLSLSLVLEGSAKI
jgi:hypothetical protein